ncbi:hypothetical protein HDU96_006114 [Phlyctochytrium bullatum]|nr:hypothetical protein HDU96_006114 [Phlyctochytrium bullatum]
MLLKLLTPVFLLAATAAATPLKNAFVNQEPLLGDEIRVPRNSLQVTHLGGKTSWTAYKLPAFPSHQIRVKEDVSLCDTGVKQYSGYLDVDDKHFFFWFFESRAAPSTDPLVLWLNGGPGCSSLTGLLMELGPCRVNESGNGTTFNEYSWNTNANVVFLDQPTDVGFSYSESGEGVSTTTDAARDVYAFLQLFLAAYPKYLKNEFHVTGILASISKILIYSGESYAGHYIPAIASAILDGNNDVGAPDGDSSLEKINLASIAIGNGMTDPAVQYEYYSKFACENSYGPVLEQSECDSMASRYPFCRSLIDACYKYEGTFSCVPGGVYCNNAMIGPFQKTGLNIYDIRKKCDPNNSLCYSKILSDIESYLNRADIQEKLGVERSYQGCNMQVNQKFFMAGDWMRPYVNLLPGILDEGVKVLIYAGDSDYICNWMGNEAWTLALEWEGKEGFNAAPEVAWTSKITGRKAGTYRKYEGLAFLRVFEAGHMVPYDQPEHSNEFINVWISKKDLEL